MMTAPEHRINAEKYLVSPFGKGEKKPPVCMSTDAIKQLLAAIDSSVDEGLRHLALLSLMYDSACRVQEIIGLNVMDFPSWPMLQDLFPWKGKQISFYSLLSETEKIVSKYIKRFRLTPDAPLFL